MNDERAELRVAGTALCVAVVCALLALMVAMSGCALQGGTPFGHGSTRLKRPVVIVVGQPGATVRLERVNPAVDQTATTDAQGRATFADVQPLPERAINVHITAQGFLAYLCAPARFASDGPVTWALGDTPLDACPRR
jgi:hypothetical protein